MNRQFRIRRANKEQNVYEVMYPQTVTANVLRRDGGATIDTDLDRYDYHLASTHNHFNRAVSSGSGKSLVVNIPGKVLSDGFPLLLKLHDLLEYNAMISFNGGSPASIVTSSGEYVPGGQMAGSSLFLVWNSTLGEWVLLNSDLSANMTKVMIPVQSEYLYTSAEADTSVIIVPGYDSKEHAIMINHGQMVLRKDIDYNIQLDGSIKLRTFTLDAGDQLLFTITKYVEVTRKGFYNYTLQTVDTVYEAPINGTVTIPLPNMGGATFSLLVNYRQTILRKGIDYVVNSDDTITLQGFSLNAQEVIMFTTTQYVESTSSVSSNNSGTTGTYRYALNVVRNSYTATENNVSTIAVPDFNRRRDSLFVVRNNLMLIEATDYNVDEVGNVVLTRNPLQINDVLNFTILQGAMIDVPKFNVADCTTDGKIVTVNVSYSEISDFYSMILRLPSAILDEPLIKCLNGPTEPILGMNGKPVKGGNVANSFMFLVYNIKNHCWYCLGETVIKMTSDEMGTVAASGTGYFSGQSDDVVVNGFHETIIHHNLDFTPTAIEITPCEPPTILNGAVTSIGDIWVHADFENIYVGNSGKSVSKFKWVIFQTDIQDDDGSLQYLTVTELPVTGDPHIIYLMAEPDSGDPHVYTKYMWINDKWDILGSTNVDLTDYVKYDDIATATLEDLNTLFES